jgi:hypothetical protein
VVLAAVGR